MTDLTPHRVLGEAAPLDEIGSLRRDAWGPLVGPARADERFGIGDEDRAAWHVVICEGATLVAAGRLVVREQPTDLPEAGTFDAWTHLMAAPLGFASRLAVRPSSQGQGLAALIIIERLALARSLGLTQVWGETRAGHVHGLERHGYRLLGASADESVPGEWHVMCAPLDATGEAALAAG